MVQHLELNPDVVCSPLADGGVLFDLTTKQYYALNETGLLLWQALEDGVAPGPLLAQIAGRYPDHHADGLGLREFVASLVELGLASSDGASNGPDSAALKPLPTTWVLPTVAPHGRPLSKVILSPLDPTIPIPE